MDILAYVPEGALAHKDSMTYSPLEFSLFDLLWSHDELRAALRVAGNEIRKLNFGRSDSPVLKLLRRVLRESRAVAAGGNQSKARITAVGMLRLRRAHGWYDLLIASAHRRVQIRTAKSPD
jgi:hypothetical protein